MKKIYTHLVFLISLFILTMGQNGNAFASTFLVTNLNNSGTGSLRQAISEANSDGDASPSFPHIIDASNLQGTIFLSNTLSINNHIIINGPMQGALILDGGVEVDANGNTTGGIRVLSIGASRTVVLNRLTIQKGRADDTRSVSTYAFGGAGINNFGNLTLNNCIVKECRAYPANNLNNSVSGGAICNQSNANLTLNETSLISNYSNGDGAAIYNQVENNVKIFNSNIVSNVLNDGNAQRGAGIFLFRGFLEVENSTFAYNEILSGSGNGNGGAIWIQTSSISESYAKLTNTTVAFNYAYSFAGGIGVNGIAGEQMATLELNHCAVVGNHCYNNTGLRTDGGGGIRLNNSSTKLIINNSLVLGNSQGDIATSASMLPAPNTVGGRGRNIFSRLDGIVYSEFGNNTIGGPEPPGFVMTGNTDGYINNSNFGVFNNFYGNNRLNDNGGNTQTIAIASNISNDAYSSVNDIVITDQRGLKRNGGGIVTRGSWERFVISPTISNIEQESGIFVVASPPQTAEVLTKSVTISSQNNEPITSLEIEIAEKFEEDFLSLPSNPYLDLPWEFENSILKITGSAGPKIYEAIARSITFNTTKNQEGTRDFQFKATSANGQSNIVSRDFEVKVSAKPNIIDLENEPLLYNSGNHGSSISTRLKIESPFPNIIGATLQIVNALDGDQLKVLSNPINGLEINWDSETNTLNLSGSASLQNYQDLIRAVVFENEKQFEVGGLRTVTIIINDGIEESLPVAREIQVEDFVLAGCSGEQVFPIGFPLIDVTKPPYNAVPDDIGHAHFNTIAIQRAMDDVSVGGTFEKYMIYFPVGTYYINDKIAGGSSDFASHYYYFQGQCRDKTIIRLVDSSPGFSNASQPKEMISFFEGTFTNNAYRNFLQNLTVHTGSGNDGAIAVKFFGNNSGGLRNVTITSSGGEGAGASAGVTALDLNFNLSGISFMKNVRIEGFQRAVHAGRPHCMFTFENLEIIGQSKEGILVDNKPVTIRNLKSKNSVPAIRAINGGSQIVLLDSDLQGGSSENNALEIYQGNHYLVRNVTRQGYENLIGGEGINTVIDLPLSGEYASEVFSNNLEEDQVTLNVDIPSVPEVAWEYNFEKWAIIDGKANDNGNNAGDFNSIVDDGPVIQEAVDSGKTFIAFVNQIDIRSTVTLRNEVAWIIGNWVNVFIRQPVRNGNPTFTPGTDIAFQIENTGSPLKVEGFRAIFGASHTTTIFNNNRSEDLILADLDYPQAVLYRNTGSGNVFFEMVFTVKPTPSQITDGASVGERSSILIKNQNAYAWAMNIEIQEEHCDGDCAALFTNDGGNAVLIGGKFGERDGLFFELKNGSQTEILGSVINISKNNYLVPTDRQVLINNKSDVSASFIERKGRLDANDTRAFHTKFIKEIDNCEGEREFNALVAETDNVLPLRQGVGSEAEGSVVPLYVGRYKKPYDQEIQFNEITSYSSDIIGETIQLEIIPGASTAPLIVTLFDTDIEVAELNGLELTIKGTGQINIKASQGCDLNFTAATDVIRSFKIINPELAIEPIVECVYKNEAGQYMAVFGYENHNEVAVTIPFGDKNKLSPGNYLSGIVPEKFEPGRVNNAFEIQLFNNNSLHWTIEGPNGKAHKAKAFKNSPSCNDREFKEFYLKIYPTKSSGNFTIEAFNSSENEESVIKIMNLFGDLVYEKSGIGNWIDQPNLNISRKGVCIVYFMSQTGFYSSKIIII